MSVRTLEDIATKPGERSVIIGLSGCGKTNLARELINVIPDAVIIDSKREWPHEGYNVITRAVELPWQLKLGRFPILYKPGPHEFSNLKVYDRIFEQLFKRGNVTCYIDEIAAFATANQSPHYLKALYAQGRSRGIRMIGGTQRPSGIPKSCITECNGFYCFSLNDKQDQRTVQAYVKGYSSDDLDQYEFFYYRRDFTGPAEKCKMPDPRMREASGLLAS